MPVPGGLRRAAVARAAGGAGRVRPARARVGDPRAVRQARRERAAPPAARGRRGRSAPRSACSATWSATRRATCTRAPASCSSAGAFGVWLVGEAGAVLVRPGGRRVHCWCVHAEDRSLPSADRIAHLLLALRTDEQGFATVANLAFSGSRRRVRRRLHPASARARRRGRRGSTDRPSRRTGFHPQGHVETTHEPRPFSGRSAPSPRRAAVSRGPAARRLLLP